MTLIPALSRARHHSWSWQGPSDYGFACDRRAIPICLSDAHHAATCFPLVIGSDHLGPELMVLLRHAATGPTVFVDDAGRWCASWVPPRLLAWPFDLTVGPGDAYVLGLHEDSTLVSPRPDHLPIFAPLSANAGESGPTLSEQAAQATRALHHYARDLPATRRAIAALDQLGLLVPLDTKPDLRIIDATASEKMSDEQVLELHHSGALGLFHASLVSLAHLPWMQRAERLQATAARPTVHNSHKESTIDFLTAISNAEASDTRLKDWNQSFS